MSTNLFEMELCSGALVRIDRVGVGGGRVGYLLQLDTARWRLTYIEAIALSRALRKTAGLMLEASHGAGSAGGEGV